MEASLLQSRKANIAIRDTLLGIVRVERLEQLANTPHSILVTLSGMVIEFRFLQLANAQIPILFKFPGIVTDVRLVQPEKA